MFSFKHTKNEGEMVYLILSKISNVRVYKSLASICMVDESFFWVEVEVAERLVKALNSMFGANGEV